MRKESFDSSDDDRRSAVGKVVVEHDSCCNCVEVEAKKDVVFAAQISSHSLGSRKENLLFKETQQKSILSLLINISSSRSNWPESSLVRGSDNNWWWLKRYFSRSWFSWDHVTQDWWISPFFWMIRFLSNQNVVWWFWGKTSSLRDYWCWIVDELVRVYW
jgi:hypothetical protein